MGRNHPPTKRKRVQIDPRIRSESNNEGPLRPDPTFIQKILHPRLQGIAAAVNNAAGTDTSSWVRHSIIRPSPFKRPYASHRFSMKIRGEKPPPGYQWQSLRNEAGIVKEPGPYPLNLRKPLARFITQKAKRKQGLLPWMLRRPVTTYEAESLAPIVERHHLHNNGSGSSGGYTRRKRRHSK
jgi:hypothetical protein